MGLTKTEVECQSKIATEKGLMELGKVILLKEQNREKREDNKIFVKKLLDGESYNYLDIDGELLISSFKNFVKHSEDEINELKSKLKNSERNIENQEKASDDLLDEIKDWELKYNEKEIYQTKRVISLREIFVANQFIY